MTSAEPVTIPVLSGLIPGGLRAGTALLVEVDPESQWFAVASTITAKVLNSDGDVGYNAMGRPPEDVERDLSTLGVNVAKAFEEGHLSINDWYSATLTGGRIEPLAPGVSVVQAALKGSKMLSVKVPDLSVEFLKDSRLPTESSGIYSHTWPAGTLNIADSLSMFLRFNDENAYAEFMETRLIPRQRKMQRISIMGLIRGMHSDWFYKRIEAATDGVLDLQVKEHEGKAKNFLRIRSLRGQPHDSAWHQIEIKPTGEAVLTN